MVAVTAEHGVQGATVERVSTRAGVSRATFYQHFSRKDECLQAALAEVQRSAVAFVGARIASEPPERAAAASTQALLEYSERKPAAARLLMSDALASGPATRSLRGRAVAEIAELIESAYRELPAASVLPDLPSEVLVGAVQRLLASRMRRGARDSKTFADDLEVWLGAYAHPIAEHRWRGLGPSAPPARSRFLSEGPLRAPAPLEPGRGKRSSTIVSENHELRIIFATAETVHAGGYEAATVAEITRRADLDGRVFYRLFGSKADALMGVHELAFQKSMALASGAFFSADQWAARIWEAGRVFTQFFEQNPTLMHACLIESHAGNGASVERLDQLTWGFTIFLEEGSEHQRGRSDQPPSELALEAVIACNLEALYREASSAQANLPGLLPHLSYMALAPFLGAARAGELVAALKRSTS